MQIEENLTVETKQHHFFQSRHFVMHLPDVYKRQGAIIANGFHIEGRVWIDDNDDGIKNAAESYNGENGLTVSVISEDTQAEVGRTQVQADGTDVYKRQAQALCVK